VTHHRHVASFDVAFDGCSEFASITTIFAAQARTVVPDDGHGSRVDPQQLPQHPFHLLGHASAGTQFFEEGCEGLTNAVEHAQATRVALSTGRIDGKLIITITDDGIGGATPVRGSGLHGLADRVAAFGGTLHIVSQSGSGTTLTAELPCGS
jgi:hypothetical protein